MYSADLDQIKNHLECVYELLTKLKSSVPRRLYENQQGVNFTPNFDVADIWKNFSFANRKRVTEIISNKMKIIVNHLVDAMAAIDPLLKARVISVGSGYEQTKIGYPDEFDFDVVLTTSSNTCEVSSSPVCPKG